MAPKPDYQAFSEICVSAVNCNRCFAASYARPAYIDVAQPRYVGQNYWTAIQRRLFLMINPGSGKQTLSNKIMREDIYKYRDGTLDLSSLFQRQRKYMSEWGRNGQFLRYFTGIGCNLNDIAFINVAWCADMNDCYPDDMLDTCFSAHTQKAIETLRPTKIFACGGVAQKYARKEKLPFVAIPHYAARGTVDYQALRGLVGA